MFPTVSNSADAIAAAGVVPGAILSIGLSLFWACVIVLVPLAAEPERPGARTVAAQRRGAFVRYRLLPDDALPEHGVEIRVPAAKRLIPVGTVCRLDLSMAHVFLSGAKAVTAAGDSYDAPTGSAD